MTDSEDKAPIIVPLSKNVGTRATTPITGSWRSRAPGPPAAAVVCGCPTHPSAAAGCRVEKTGPRHRGLQGGHGPGSPGPSPAGSPACPVFEGLLPASARWCRAPRSFLHRFRPPPVGPPGQSSSGSPSSESSPRPPRPVVVGLPCLPPPARWRRAPRPSGSPARPPGPSTQGYPARPPCPIFVKRE